MNTGEDGFLVSKRLKHYPKRYIHRPRLLEQPVKILQSSIKVIVQSTEELMLPFKPAPLRLTVLILACQDGLPDLIKLFSLSFDRLFLLKLSFGKGTDLQRTRGCSGSWPSDHH